MFNTDDFDAEFYLSFYSDLVPAGIIPSTAYTHYKTFGKKENRVGSRHMLTQRSAQIANVISSNAEQLQNIHLACYADAVEPLITILVRTSSRPKSFNACLTSIHSQCYKNFQIVICYDTDDSLEYLEAIKLSYSSEFVSKIFFFKVSCPDLNHLHYVYNYYCNLLLSKVCDGYVLYLDDDDMFANPYGLYAIQQAIEYSPKESIYVWKIARPDIVVFPSNFGSISVGEINTSSFCMHHSFSKTRGIGWRPQRYGDHDFFTRLLIPDENARRPKIVEIPYILINTQNPNIIGHNGLSECVSLSPLEPTACTFYDFFPQFNWSFYVSLYVDLQKQNIMTRTSAEQHYLNFGRFELRRTHEIVSNPEEGLRTLSFNNSPLALPIPVEYLFVGAWSVRVSSSLSNLRDLIVQKYGWSVLSNTESVKDLSNVIFFGVYSDDDIQAIKEYSGRPRYIIWGGEDANIENVHSRQTITEISRLSSCVHVSISKCLYLQLLWNFPTFHCIFVTFTLVDHQIFTPIPKISNSPDDTIYIYVYNGSSPGREHIYGKSVYDQVIQKLSILEEEEVTGVCKFKFKFIYSSVDRVSYKEMPEVYSKCCIMLRLTSRDGNANSVQECEAIGIPVVHNLSNYGLKWKTADDVIDHILSACEPKYRKIVNSK